MEHNKKAKNITHAVSLDKNLKFINKNKDLENLIQDINSINKNILRYAEIENLLKSDIKFDNEEDELHNLQKNFGTLELRPNNIKATKKQKLFGDCKQLCNKIYNSPKKTIEAQKNINHKLCIKDIKPYNNSIKEVMNSIFKGKNVKIRNRYLPLCYSKTNEKNKINNLAKKLFTEPDSKDNSDKNIKFRNDSFTDRVIEEYKEKKYQNNFYLPRTIETDRRINVNYGSYASNKVKFKHPQFYVLNTNNTPIRKKLPPIKEGKLNMVDLLRKNNSQFNIILNKKRNKYDKYYLAMRMGEIYKFKVD